MAQLSTRRYSAVLEPVGTRSKLAGGRPFVFCSHRRRPIGSSTVAYLSR